MRHLHLHHVGLDLLQSHGLLALHHLRGKVKGLAKLNSLEPMDRSGLHVDLLGEELVQRADEVRVEVKIVMRHFKGQD